MNTVGHLINGQVISDAARLQDVYNPSTGEVSKQVALASKATVEQAIAAAEAAFPEWRNTPPIKRARVMFRFKELLEQNAERIAQMIGEEHGKIAHDALGELQRQLADVREIGLAFLVGLRRLADQRAADSKHGSAGGNAQRLLLGLTTLKVRHVLPPSRNGACGRPQTIEGRSHLFRVS